MSIQAVICGRDALSKQRFFSFSAVFKTANNEGALYRPKMPPVLFSYASAPMGMGMTKALARSRNFTFVKF